MQWFSDGGNVCCQFWIEVMYWNKENNMAFTFLEVNEIYSLDLMFCFTRKYDFIREKKSLWEKQIINKLWLW